MGLVMLIGILVLISGTSVLGLLYNPYWVLLNLLIVPLCGIPISIQESGCSILNINFPYHAEVTIDNNEEKTDIYFSEFSQDGSQIVIDSYATETIHWTNFKLYNIENTPIKITLKDNDGKFIYTDRQNNEAFNYNIIATQP